MSRRFGIFKCDIVAVDGGMGSPFTLLSAADKELILGFIRNCFVIL